SSYRGDAPNPTTPPPMTSTIGRAESPLRLRKNSLALRSDGPDDVVRRVTTLPNSDWRRRFVDAAPVRTTHSRSRIECSKSIRTGVSSSIGKPDWEYSQSDAQQRSSRHQASTSDSASVLSERGHLIMARRAVFK